MKKLLVLAVFFCSCLFAAPLTQAADHQVVKVTAAVPVFKDTQKIAVFSKGSVHTVTKSDRRFYFSKIGDLEVKFSKQYAHTVLHKADQLKSANPVRIITKKHLTVYSKPSVKSAPFGHLQSKQTVFVQRLKGDFYPVIFGGKTGYIYRKDVQNLKGLPVIMYHDLVNGNAGDNMSVLEVSKFKEQMNYLKVNGWRTITPDELTLWLQKKIKLPEKSVLITFDDGYSSTADLAYPILKANKLKATTFLIASRINRSGYLSEQQIQATQDFISYQNHTYDLHGFNSMTGLALLEYTPRIKIYEDILKASHTIQQIVPKQPAVTALAYPYGKRNTETLRASKIAGIKSGFTITEGNVFQGDSPFHLNRQRVHSGMSLKDFEKKLIGQ